VTSVATDAKASSHGVSNRLLRRPRGTSSRLECSLARSCEGIEQTICPRETAPAATPRIPQRDRGGIATIFVSPVSS
jgi:hypothetical protein